MPPRTAPPDTQLVQLSATALLVVAPELLAKAGHAPSFPWRALKFQLWSPLRAGG